MLLVRYGEITLKTPPVRKRMERKLIYNSLVALGDLVISYEQEPGRIFFYTKDDEEAARRLAKVFGIVAVAIAKEYELDSTSLRALEEVAKKIAEDVSVRGSFKVSVRRVGEHQFTSVDAARIIGKYIHELGFPVDLEDPDTVVHVEIRGKRVFVYTEEIRGPGGLPLGVEGNAIALISGGIDSPVAAWYTMRRGVITHFLHGRPVDSQEYLDRVKEIVEVLRSRAIGENPRFFIFDLREFVEYVGRKRPKYTTVLVKRRLIRLAESVSERVDAKAIVLGDSIGQVSSQTLHNMRVIDQVAKLTVLRPLAGFDKSEIIKKAQEIGTYRISEKHEERARKYVRSAITRVDPRTIEEIEKDLEKIETPLLHGRDHEEPGSGQGA